MLARAPSDAQVEKMIPRFLANSTPPISSPHQCIASSSYYQLRVCAGSEFAVNNETRFGMPSVSRSSSAAKDNNYWRGRRYTHTSNILHNLMQCF